MDLSFSEREQSQIDLLVAECRHLLLSTGVQGALVDLESRLGSLDHLWCTLLACEEFYRESVCRIRLQHRLRDA